MPTVRTLIARTNGQIELVNLIKRNDDHIVIRGVDAKRSWKLFHNNPKCKEFHDTDSAIQWITESRSNAHR